MEREIKRKLHFTGKGEFKGFYNAQGWLSKNGYLHGYLSNNDPVEIFKVHKELVEGVIVSQDFKGGMVTVLLFD